MSGDWDPGYNKKRELKKKTPYKIRCLRWAVRGSNSRHSGCKPDARTSWANCPKKAGSYLLSRNESSIIGVRELDFRVRNGNGYYLSTMATGIINNAIYEVRKFLSEARRTDIRLLRALPSQWRFCFMNGNDDMAKSHDLLVMLGWTPHDAYTCILSTW